jgi:hypothetical protein
MKWLKTYLREVTGETWTFVGLLTAYFTLDGSAKKVTGLLIMIGALVWLVTLPLRQDDEKD